MPPDDSSPAPDVLIARLVDRFVRRIHASLQANSSQFDPEKIGPGGSMILLTLSEIGPVPMNELARRMARDKSQMTRAVRMLEDKGFVQKAGLGNDGRVSVVSLSNKGQAQVEVLQAVLAKTITGILGPLSSDDRERLVALLSQVDP